MQIEVTYRTGAVVAVSWDAEPNLRAEIKMKIAEVMGRILRTSDLIEWDATKTANGDFVVRGFLRAEPGTEKLVEYTLDLNPVT